MTLPPLSAFQHGLCLDGHAPSTAIPPPRDQVIQIHSTMNLDGQAVDSANMQLLPEVTGHRNLAVFPLSSVSQSRQTRRPLQAGLVVAGDDKVELRRVFEEILTHKPGRLAPF